MICSLILETVVAKSIYMDFNGPPVPYNDSRASVPRTNRYQWFLPQLTGNATEGDQMPPAAVIASVELGLSYSASYEVTYAMDAPYCPT